MKKEYRDSILASLSKFEWKELLSQIDLPRAKLTSQFITHLTIERPSKNKRKNPIKIPTPFYLKPFKNLYVSRPR